MTIPKTDLPIDLERIEDAVHKWFSSTTGLQVVWRKQNAPQPKYPFGSLAIIAGPTPVSPFTIDEQDYSAKRVAGKEIRFEHGVPCTLTISCQAYVEGDDVHNPNADARSYLLRALVGLSHFDVRSLFDAENIASQSTQGPTDLSLVIGREWISRANLDVIFNATLTSDEYTGYINRVHLHSDSLGVDEIVDGV